MKLSYNDLPPYSKEAVDITIRYIHKHNYTKWSACYLQLIKERGSERVPIACLITYEQDHSQYKWAQQAEESIAEWFALFSIFGVLSKQVENELMALVLGGKNE